MTALQFIFAGDVILDEPDPDRWLSGIAPALHKADIAIGHLEVPHTRRGGELHGDVPAPGADPDHVPALARAGFSAMTLAGNHMADRGAEGIDDTIDALRRAGIGFCGAGRNAEAARAPAYFERGGKRIALLSYNCVGPEASWATATRAGCAYVHVRTADGSPSSPSASLTAVDPQSLAQFRLEIEAARRDADIAIVALHKGIVHTPARLAPYEQPLAHAAVDAGADVVIGHHAHIARGIELYRGKPIFHGLGNGCVVTRALSPDQDHPARAAWAKRRRELFGFDPDPAYYLAPFHPEAVCGLLGCVRIRDDGRAQVGFIPLHVEPPGRPTLATGERAHDVVRYIESITAQAGLPAIAAHFDGETAWLS